MNVPNASSIPAASDTTPTPAAGVKLVAQLNCNGMKDMRSMQFPAALIHFRHALKESKNLVIQHLRAEAALSFLEQGNFKAFAAMASPLSTSNITSDIHLVIPDDAEETLILHRTPFAIEDRGEGEVDTLCISIVIFNTALCYHLNSLQLVASATTNSSSTAAATISSQSPPSPPHPRRQGQDTVLHMISKATALYQKVIQALLVSIPYLPTSSEQRDLQTVNTLVTAVTTNMRLLQRPQQQMRRKSNKKNASSTGGQNSAATA